MEKIFNLFSNFIWLYLFLSGLFALYVSIKIPEYHWIPILISIFIALSALIAFVIFKTQKLQFNFPIFSLIVVSGVLLSTIIILFNTLISVIHSNEKVPGEAYFVILMGIVLFFTGFLALVISVWDKLSTLQKGLPAHSLPTSLLGKGLSRYSPWIVFGIFLQLEGFLAVRCFGALGTYEQPIKCEVSQFVINALVGIGFTGGAFYQMRKSQRKEG